MKNLKSLVQNSEPFFMAEQRNNIVAGKTHIIGFEFDGTACFRKGTRKGPDAIREISDGIESYSPYLDRDLEDMSIVDLGNIEIREKSSIENTWHQMTSDYLEVLKKSDIKNDGTKFLTLGGEHSISYASISHYLSEFNDLVLVHLDAHADLRDGYEGYKYSHASIIRRSLDHFSESNLLIQYGIRSGTREEFKWMKENKTIKTSLNELLKSIEAIDDNRPIYLTLDLDYFDPCYMPGTGTPEAGGEDFSSFVNIMKLLASKNLVGADVVELSPEIDKTGNSSVFAAKVVREVLLSMN